MEHFAGFKWRWRKPLASELHRSHNSHSLHGDLPLEFKNADRKQNETKKSKRKKKLLMKECFHSVNCIKDYTIICFFFYVNRLLLVVSFVLLAASFKLRLLHSSHKLIAIQFFYFNILMFKKPSTKKSFS